MWFSGCLLAAPTTLFPSILSFPLPSFICVLPIPVFFRMLLFFGLPPCTQWSLSKNRSLDKVYENHNILAFLASGGTLVISETVIAPPKKVWFGMKGENETLNTEEKFGEYGNIKKKRGVGGCLKNPRSRNRVWRRERWNRKWGIKGEGGLE